MSAEQRTGFAVNLKERFFGSPWVYRWLRPLLLGGFDFSNVYKWLNCGNSDILVDIGCGFGNALEYVKDFREYHGFDTSPRAIEWMRSNHNDPRVHLYTREVTGADLQALAPTCITMMGLLHHIDDGAATGLLEMLSSTASLRRIITLDPIFLRGHCLNNIMCRLDRGHYCRSKKGYQRLINAAGLSLDAEIWIHPGIPVAKYFCMGLSPLRPASETFANL